MKSVCGKDACTPMFNEALFTIANIWTQPKCMLMDEWVKESQYRTMQNYSKKEGNLVIFNNMDKTEGHYAKWNELGTEKTSTA